MRRERCDRRTFLTRSFSCIASRSLDGSSSRIRLKRQLGDGTQVDSSAPVRVDLAFHYAPPWRCDLVHVVTTHPVARRELAIEIAGAHVLDGSLGLRFARRSPTCLPLFARRGATCSRSPSVSTSRHRECWTTGSSTGSAHRHASLSQQHTSIRSTAPKHV